MYPCRHQTGVVIQKCCVVKSIAPVTPCPYNSTDLNLQSIQLFCLLTVANTKFALYRYGERMQVPRIKDVTSDCLEGVQIVTKMCF